MGLFKRSGDSGEKPTSLSSDDEKGYAQNYDANGEPLAPRQSVKTGEIQYITMRWWQAGALMVAEIVSLGVLSLPHAVSLLGFGPGLAMIVGFGLIATYSGWLIGEFKNRHLHLKDNADVGEMIFSLIGLPRFGRALFGLAQVLFLLFIAAAHVLTFSIMMNVLTSHGTCSIVFAVVGAVLSLIICSPRKLGTISIWAVISCISIVSSVVICMIILGIEYPSGGITSALPQETLQLAPALVAVMDIVLAYSGNVAFIGFINEMKEPKDFPKALAMLQTTTIIFYAIVASVIYYYAGVDVKSPALSSTSNLWERITYGIACPTIVVAGVINGHVAIKQIYVTICSPEVVYGKGFKSLGIWGSILLSFWALAWVIAEAVPNFNALLALISALFGSFFTYGVPGMMWLYDWRKGNLRKSWTTTIQLMLTPCLFILALAFMGLGVYSSIVVIIGNESGGSFSCADNVGS